MNCLAISNFIFLLSQTAKQRQQTIVSVGLLCLVASLFIMDMFAKNAFGAGKTLKRLIMVFCLIILAVFVFLVIFYSQD